MDEAIPRRTAAQPRGHARSRWHATGDGRGAKAMVVLPYKDGSSSSAATSSSSSWSPSAREGPRRPGGHQGLAVYGNKGSTDQHAYVQQLRDGVTNFFVTFVRELGSEGARLEVEPGATCGDYLHGFLLGTRGRSTRTGGPRSRSPCARWTRAASAC